MPAGRNPFRPTFGASPPLLVGRELDVEDFVDGLTSGPGALERATLVTGLRGAGKTVLLNAFEDQARELGWLVISETAGQGLLERLTSDHLPRMLGEHDEMQTKSQVTGAQLGPVAAQRQVREMHVAVPSLRAQLDRLTDIQASRGSGVLITIDEVHRRTVDELSQLSATIQHAFREGREVAFAAAGLPAAVSDVLNQDVSTFLRRADRRHLGMVDEDSVAEGLRSPIEAAGARITDQALQRAVTATRGYPFMIQLVGRETWNKAPTEEIDEGHVIEAVRSASRRVGQLVHGPALNDLSPIDKSYLVAMSVDDGPSSTGEICRRLGVDPAYGSVYRQRLLDAELIHRSSHGYVDFLMPYLREYLREHAAGSALPGPTSDR